MLTRWLLAICLCVATTVQAFPQARAGAWPGATQCVAWLDGGLREVLPVSPVDPQYADEAPYAGICRYDLTGIAVGPHQIEWALIYSDGTETARQVPLAFNKPGPPTNLAFVGADGGGGGGPAMAVAFDKGGTGYDWGGTTATTAAFTIGSGANRICLIGLVTIGAAPGAISSVSCGGQSGSTTPLASINGGSIWLNVFLVKNPAAGSQTASVVFATSNVWEINALTFTGVDQTTSTNGVVTNSSASNSVSQSITSTSGDMTASFHYDNNPSSRTITSGGTTRLGAATTPASTFGSAATGDGSGTATHTWTLAGTFANYIIGINVVQASAGAAASLPPSRSQASRIARLMGY